MTIQDRIKAALERIRNGNAHMRVPADQTDADIVLADCLSLLGPGGAIDGRGQG